MIRQVVFWLAALTPSISYAAEPNPEPIRKWVIATYKTLAEVARDNPLSQEVKMWEKIDECVPKGPIELRAKPQSLNWKEGVLTVRINEPLGWYKRKGLSSPQIQFMPQYYVYMSEEEALKLRNVTFVIIRAPLTLFKDYGEFLKNHNDTHRIILTVDMGAGRSAKLASDAIELELGGTKYPVVYDK